MTCARPPSPSSSTSLSRQDVASRIRFTPTTRRLVARSIHARTFSVNTSGPAQDDLAECLVAVHQLVRFSDLVEVENGIDDWLEPATLEELHTALRELALQLDFFF